MKKAIIAVFIFSSLLLASCSYNPFYVNNHTTGTATGTIVGAGVGAGTAALFGAKPWVIGLSGIGGGMFGYYVTTLRYDAGPIYQRGGQVYQVGNIVGIYIPSDQLFEPNTAELLPRATTILDSTAVVLQRYPNNNIIVSGNTSGFYHDRWEQQLSERRAKVISAYLWNAGINDFRERSADIRRLNYVGYGDYFPIANVYTNKGIRANSRVQIISYPSDCDLLLDKRRMVFNNVGATSDQSVYDAPAMRCRDYDDYGNCLPLDPRSTTDYWLTPKMNM